MCCGQLASTVTDMFTSTHGSLCALLLLWIPQHQCCLLAFLGSSSSTQPVVTKFFSSTFNPLLSFKNSLCLYFLTSCAFIFNPGSCASNFQLLPPGSTSTETRPWHHTLMHLSGRSTHLLLQTLPPLPLPLHSHSFSKAPCCFMRLDGQSHVPDTSKSPGPLAQAPPCSAWCRTSKHAVGPHS